VLQSADHLNVMILYIRNTVATMKFIDTQNRRHCKTDRFLYLSRISNKWITDRQFKLSASIKRYSILINEFWFDGPETAFVIYTYTYVIYVQHTVVVPRVGRSEPLPPWKSAALLLGFWHCLAMCKINFNFLSTDQNRLWPLTKT